MKFQFGFDGMKDTDLAPLKIQHTDADTPFLLSKHLQTIFSKLPTYQPIVVICVGTDRSTGDSLGPLVGSHLNRTSNLRNLHLFGTLDEPVHAMNLSETVDKIQRQFDNPFIVAVDACLGQVASVGCIQVADGPLKPGAGVNKDLPPVGNIHVTGIVNVGGFMEYFVLQNTRLSLVMNMANVIGDALYSALRRTQAYAPSTKTALKFD
ncbi:spore protease YyaC [Paenibacillus aceris]|uniref:Sporulation protein YyaC n=1 Tax=Paenibacillus aceris TaxID=869555 RepID=A0ABS4HYU2_9BACL|nr:spore protease YyaC [Paenibacillus aceris]MBP1963807.1 putative sporulation protein YyaC [Paenibacillus aceris]NHW34770.1 spore protease YyaC [Paenibacillus aceris]